MSKPAVSFSPQQGDALKAIAAWYKNKRGPQVFYLGGYAGTGKTTLAMEAASMAKADAVNGETDPRDEMICRDHGRLASKRTRAIWRRLYKRADRLQQKDPDLCSPAEIDLTLRMLRLERKAWERFKSECIERAGGLH